MNKARRHELKMLKFKKRLRNYQLEESPEHRQNFHALRSHGSPCSCCMCSGEKYERERDKTVTELIEIEMNELDYKYTTYS